MRSFFLMFIMVSIVPFVSYAQYGGGDNTEKVDIVDEVDQIDLSEMLKLQETIPVAEKNCLRIKRNSRECRCDNGYLYREYDGVLTKLSERHPNWNLKVLKYDFYLDGVTYKGESDIDTLKRYSDKYNVLDCDGKDKDKTEEE